MQLIRTERILPRREGVRQVATFGQFASYNDDYAAYFRLGSQ